MMKRLARSILGVTLLEIMLVLAIAAMIIVMSVRYYQSANTSQQANGLLTQIETISAAMNSMSQSTGNYSGLSTTQVESVLPAQGLVPPWGGGNSITVLGGKTGTFTITVSNTPPGVCALVTRQLTSSANYTPPPNCSTSTAGDLTVTYTFNPAPAASSSTGGGGTP